MTLSIHALLTCTRRWDQTISGDREPDTSLLTAVTTFSSHLTELRQTLPLLAISRLHRRIVSHLSNHIQQRAVYAGWSKFTVIGGKDLADEVADWRKASTSSLPDIDGGVIDYPWTRLSDIGRVLSLPTDGDTNATFSQAMAAAWSGGDDTLHTLSERIGLVDVSRTELQGILRRRGDCWM